MTIRFVARTGLSIVGAVALAAAVQGVGSGGAVAAPASSHVSGAPRHAVGTPTSTLGRFSATEKPRPALTLPKTTARTGSWQHLTAAQRRSGRSLGRRVESAIRSSAWRPASSLAHIMSPGRLIEAVPDLDSVGSTFGMTENRVSCLGGELRVLSIGDPGWDGGEGAAWIFELTGGSEIEDAFEFEDPEATPGDDFGASVGFSCNLDAGFIGAPGAGGGAGLVYAAPAPGETFPFSPDAAETGGFGSSLAASNNEPFVVIGSPEASGGGNVAFISFGPGSGDLPDPNGTPGDEFGAALGLSTRHLSLIVGSPGDQTAWIFGNNSGLTPYDEMNGECDAPNFGQSVAISANGLVAVASGSDPTTTVTGTSGCAEIDQFGDGEWSYVQTLSSVNSSPVAGDDFGASVATNSNGSKIAVGEPGRADPSDPNSGDAQLFSFTGGGWDFATQYTTPESPGGTTPPVSQFGASVAVAGFRIVIGAPGTIDGGGFGNGAAFIFATNFEAEPPIYLGGCIVRPHARAVTPHC